MTGISNGTLPDHWIINIPPGFSKSTIVSVLWPAWEWATKPYLRYLFFSYTDANTIRDNVKARSIIESAWYQDSFWSKLTPPVRLSKDQNVKIKFENTSKGYRFASSVGGTGTGEHPHRIITDDLLKAKDATSKVFRKAANDFIDQTLTTRVRLNPAVIHVGQRLHEDDPTGHLLKQGDGYQLLRLPMRYETARTLPDGTLYTPDPRDPRTYPGELMWPAVYPESKVRALEISLNPYGTAGQLQQRPVPLAGGLFKREYFSRFVDVAPVQANRCRGWDTAASEAHGDHTACVKLAITNEGIIYIEHAYRDQISPFNVDKVMHQYAETDGRYCRIREEREPGSSGITVVTLRSRSFIGYDYAWVAIDSDKVSRSNAFRAQCEAGNVVIVRDSANYRWNEAYINALCNFMGDDEDDDDYVDASSCAFNSLGLEPRAGMFWGRDKT